jgi:WD40 repeat protein
VTQAAWSSDGSRLVIGTPQGVQVWDAQTGQEIARIAPAVGNLTSVTWAGDGKRIAVGELGVVNVWELAGDTSSSTAVAPATEASHRHNVPGMEIGGIAHISWRSDDSRLLSVSRNGTAEIWDAQSGAGLAWLQGHTAAVTHGAWSPGDGLVATASADGTAQWLTHRSLNSDATPWAILVVADVHF